MREIFKQLNKDVGISRKKGGFTLIEIIVALGVFSIAMLMGVGLLLSITAAQKRAIALRQVMDNLGFAFETMTKEIRTGHNYYCGVSFNPDYKDCSDGRSSFSFISSTGDVVVYKLDSVRKILEKSENGGSFLPLTSPEVKVTKLKFYVKGSNYINEQPRVLIMMSVQFGDFQKRELNLQTMISQRTI